jgi:peptidyl-prolyl cis-trans isomerase SurA
MERKFDMRVVYGMILILCIVTLFICGCATKSSDIVVLEVGNAKISLAEYEKFFSQNSGGWEGGAKSTLEEREHFLDLLTNYKLKIQYAADHNLMNDSDIVNEINDYRSSLASTFLIEREITDPALNEIYDRKKEELRAKHILLKVTPNATPEETLKIYTKAMDIIRRAKAGESFDSLAVHNSDDPSVKTTLGDLYWFSGGMMVAPFENAAYALKKGEICPVPARSSFGYHIIKIIDRQPSRGSVKVSHIMARFKKSAEDSADTLDALQRIKGIQDSLVKGLDFHALAIKLSEDGGSAPKGGDLGWFERRRFVQPFDEAAFKLKAGQTSGIVRTPFGYHLIHCDSTKPMAPLSDPQMKADLKKMYQQTRYNDDYNRYIEKLKNDYKYSFNETTFDEFIAVLDSTKTTDDSAWTENISTELLKKPLMIINGKPILLSRVVELIKTKPEYANLQLRKTELQKRLDKLANTYLLDEKSIGLEQRYPMFASLMNDYRDGIVLYKAEQNEIWNNVSVSDTVLNEYYNNNRSQFMFPNRVNIIVLPFEADTLAALVYDSLTHGANFDEIASHYREMPPPKSKDSSRGLQPDTTDELTRHAATMNAGDVSEPLVLADGSFAIIKLIAKDAAREKTFEEAGAEISNVYQDFRSKQLMNAWLDRIQQQHPVIKHKDVLPHAFTTPPPDNE